MVAGECFMPKVTNSVSANLSMFPIALSQKVTPAEFVSEKKMLEIRFEAGMCMKTKE
jgi:hypothetical protein